MLPQTKPRTVSLPRIVDTIRSGYITFAEGARVGRSEDAL